MNLIQRFALGIKAFNDAEPRNEKGEWSDGGGSGTVAHPPFSGPTRIGRGDVRPRSEFDEHRNKEVRDFLSRKGFRTTSVNADPHKPVVYTLRTEMGGESMPAGLNGSTNHSVLVYPNGEWEHSSESNHGGMGVAQLSALGIEGGKNMWPGRSVAAARRRR